MGVQNRPLPGSRQPQPTPDHALTLTLDNHSHSRRLNSARREPSIDLAPQHRRNLVSNQTVNHSSGLLGLDKIVIYVGSVCDGLLNRLFGDLIENHATDRNLGLEHFEQVPGNGLTFAVLIGCEEELVSPF